MDAFSQCSNLVKVSAPFVEKVGESVFDGEYNLCHVNFGPDVVVIKSWAFGNCLLIDVLAASVGFELDTGDRVYGRNDPTVRVTRFTKWRKQKDHNKEY